MDKIATNATTQVWEYVNNSYNITTATTYNLFDVNLNITKNAALIVTFRSELHSHSCSAGTISWKLSINNGFDDWTERQINRTSDVDGTTLMVERDLSPGTVNIKGVVQTTSINNPVEIRFSKLIIQAIYK